MSPGASAKKRLGVAGGGVGGFALGCGCRDAKAVAVAASASASPYSSSSATATDASTATTATWRRARAAAHHPSSASGSTGTLTVPSASSSSFRWEDADGDAGEEVECKQRESSVAATGSFSGLLRQLNELEQSVVSWGRKSTSGKDYFSPPPPPPPPPPLPARPVKQRAVHSGGDSKEGHGNFSPPPPTTSFLPQTTQTHRKAKSMDKADRQAGKVHSKQPPPQPPPPPPPLPLPAEQPLKAKSTDKGGRKEEDAPIFPTSQVAPKHRKAKSCDGGTGTGAGRLDGSMAVVKQSDDPLSDFRRSMVNMIVENRIATGHELRELLRHFLALNAPHHHDAILRAFTEIWDEAFSAKTTLHREPAARPTPPRQRPKAPTPPRRRHEPPPRVWR